MTKKSDFRAKWIYASCSTLNFETETTWEAVGDVSTTEKVGTLNIFSYFLVIFGYSLALNVLIDGLCKS